jgi:serine/threonine-protein kinase
VGQLCCGLAGQGYALLKLYQYSGERAWLERARRLAEQAPAGVVDTRVSRYSLYRGYLGPALLAADLERPEQARMPFFDD